MATLDDLLNNFGLDSDDGVEKVAFEQTADNEEQELLEAILGESYEKTASEGDGQMSTLADLYMQIASNDEVVEDDFDKVAAAAALGEYDEEVGVEKIAEEYDAAGRIMARGFYDEFQKLARELEDASEAQTPALGDRGTEYQMETNYEGKGPIVTKGSFNVNSDALKAPAKVDLGAQNAMGSQFTTVKNLVTARATQANAK